MKITKLEEEKAPRTVMTSYYSFKHLKSTNIYNGISRNIVFKWHGRLRDGWEESTQHGRKTFMNVRNVLFADEIRVNGFGTERSSCKRLNRSLHSLWSSDMFQKLVQTSLVYHTQRGVPL